MQSFDFVPYLPDYENDVDERGVPVCPAPAASEVETPLSAWSRIDLGKKVFQTRKNPGPPWDQVVRRVTKNLVDDSEVENLLVANAPEKFNWHAPLPEGVTDIETVLYYRAPESEAQASEAPASSSEVVAKAAPEAAPEPKDVAPPATPPSERGRGTSTATALGRGR